VAYLISIAALRLFRTYTGNRNGRHYCVGSGKRRQDYFANPYDQFLLGFDKKGRKTLNSDTKLVVNVEVPPSRIPRRVVQSGGNFIIQTSLDIIVATFVRVLSADFQRWSDGNDTRDPVEETAF
jgi:Protein of unknown function (DUF1997)